MCLTVALPLVKKVLTNINHEEYLSLFVLNALKKDITLPVVTMSAYKNITSFIRFVRCYLTGWPFSL